MARRLVTTTGLCLVLLMVLLWRESIPSDAPGEIYRLFRNAVAG